MRLIRHLDTTIPHYLDTTVRIQLTRLRHALASDRGDSPVPTAIIIVGLALLAVGVLAIASNAIDDWELLIPDAVEP